VNDMMGQVVKPVEYINGVPQPPVVKKTSQREGTLRRHGDVFSGAKLSLQLDAKNMERLSSKTTIDEPQSFYAPFDPTNQKGVNMKQRKERGIEAALYQEKLPNFDDNESWFEIFKHYTPMEAIREATILGNDGKLLVPNEDINEQVLEFFEERGYSHTLL